MKVSQFYSPGQWNEEEIKDMISRGWVIINIWEYSSSTVIGTLVTFKKQK